jgi:hypothetical protein
MGVTYNSANRGLWTNGNFELGTNQNFSFGTITADDAYTGNFSLKITGMQSSGFSDNWAQVDPTQWYVFSMRAKTIQVSSPNGYNGQAYMGFSCYDQFGNFIDLRNCGDNGNATLTRAATPGDSYIYISTNSGWTTAGDTYYFRNVLFYPATHPYYGRPWKYTRFGFGDYNLYYNEITDMGGGEWRLRLSSDGTANTTLPNMGYSLPIGTPISRGAAGGSYNYCIVSDIPTSWTQFVTSPFTGESYNSSVPFRYSTKYVKFLMLINYTHPAETTQATFLIDDVMLLQSPTSRTYNLY